MKLGLTRMLALDRFLDYPSQAIAVIHVAGTNGKGSVTTKIAKGLELAGKRVGLFTSPHISCFRERIKINGEMISESEVTRIVTQIFSYEAIEPTFFEVNTALAFAYFAEKSVDVAVIETGLGGMQDATNIVKPVLSVITSIDLDHTQFLGSTRESIAKEKGGIIKQGVPVVVGPHADLPVLREMAKEKNSPYLTVEGQFSTYDEENKAVARLALLHQGVFKQGVEEALKALPPCRFELLGDHVVLDVAHNPNGIEALLSRLKMDFPGKRPSFYFGFCQDKDVRLCIQKIGVVGQQFYPQSLPTQRGCDPKLLRSFLLEEGVAEDRVHLNKTFLEAKRASEQLVVCGSFFLMSQVRKELGIVEPIDALDLNFSGMLATVGQKG